MFLTAEDEIALLFFVVTVFFSFLYLLLFKNLFIQ